MELTLEDMEAIVRKRLRTNQILLGISIAIALVMFYLKGIYIYWSLYFVLIGSLNLPTINKTKSDLHFFKKNEVDSTQGKVLDVFPEKEDNGNWIMFLEVEGEKDPIEFVLSAKPYVEVNNTVSISHTRLLKIPFKVQVLPD